MENVLTESLTEALDAISEIQESLQGMGFNDYRTNRKIKIQTVTNLGRIIEAVEKVPLSVKEKYPDFPWDYMHKFVSLIVNDSYGVDEDTIWKIAKMELRHLEKLIKVIFFSGR